MYSVYDKQCAQNNLVVTVTIDWMWGIRARLLPQVNSLEVRV